LDSCSLHFFLQIENGVEKNADYNYQVGNGDYASMIALKDTKEYDGVTDFAHAIVGGSIKFLNPLSSSDTIGNRKDQTGIKWTDGGIAYYPEDEDLYKRFVVQSSDGFDKSRHMTWPEEYNWAPTVAKYQRGCKHDFFSPDEDSQFYDASAKPLIDFESVFGRLGEQSEALAGMPATGKATWTGTDLLLEYEGDDADTIYFELDKWDNGITSVTIKGNIDGSENYIINCPSITDISIGKDVPGQGGTVVTTIGEDIISNKGDHASNNSAQSSQILYNFPNLSTLKLNGNFNGTIFAPQAKVESNLKNTGHLSGALIANSFKGGLEFGYRPYLGLVDILRVDSDYWIDLYKYAETTDKDGNKILTDLPGAEFGLFDVTTDNKTGKTVIAENPSATAISGEDGRLQLDVQSGTYAIKEIASPNGYAIKKDVICYVKLNKKDEIEETIKTGELGTPELVTISAAEFDELKTAEKANYVAVPTTEKVYTHTYTFTFDKPIDNIVQIGSGKFPFSEVDTLEIYAIDEKSSSTDDVNSDSSSSSDTTSDSELENSSSSNSDTTSDSDPDNNSSSSPDVNSDSDPDNNSSEPDVNDENKVSKTLLFSGSDIIVKVGNENWSELVIPSEVCDKTTDKNARKIVITVTEKAEDSKDLKAGSLEKIVVKYQDSDWKWHDYEGTITRDYSVDDGKAVPPTSYYRKATEAEEKAGTFEKIGNDNIAKIAPEKTIDVGYRTGVEFWQTTETDENGKPQFSAEPTDVFSSLNIFANQYILGDNMYDFGSVEDGKVENPVEGAEYEPITLNDGTEIAITKISGNDPYKVENFRFYTVKDNDGYIVAY
ncbi:MAG: choice-of-anchor A family protein, partial [Allobaculum sp.]|nr:choice-of-anchor A family protein [Allobaculum sp.]